jgi:hypothetical protein
MKKGYLIIGLLFFLAVFSMSEKVQAVNLETHDFNNGNVEFPYNPTQAIYSIPSQGDYIGDNWGLSATGQFIAQVKIWLAVSPANHTAHDNEVVQVCLQQDWQGSQAKCNTNTIHIYDVGTNTPVPVIFTFSDNSHSIDFGAGQKLVLFSIKVNNNGAWNLISGMSTYANSRYPWYDGAWHTDKSIAYEISDKDGIVAPSSYLINFSTDFTNGSSTPDFRTWTLNITAPSRTVDTWQVKYKNASSTDWQYQDNVILGHLNYLIEGEDAFVCGLSICFGALNNQYVAMLKTINLPSGNNYQAQAFLYNTTLGHNLMTLATSTILNFTIATGTPILTPATQGQVNGGLPAGDMWDSSWCPDTSFSALGADFGKGICNVFAFLFVPNQSYLNSWLGSTGLLNNTPPFSYYYKLTNEIENMQVSSTSTLPTLNIDIQASTGTPFSLHSTLFSSSTMTGFLDTDSKSALRNIIKWVLYLGFMSEIFMLRFLFKHK